MESQPDVKLTADAAFHRAAALWRQGDYREVIALCHKIVAAAPRHADALGLLGLSLYVTGAHADALDALNRAVALARRADFLNNPALVLRGLRRQNEALDDFIAESLEYYYGDLMPSGQLRTVR